MIILENAVAFDSVNGFMAEAKELLEKFSGTFSAEEMMKLAENMATDTPELAVAFGALSQEIPLNEFMVKHVNSKGELSKTQDLKTRQRKAFQTTGLSKSARRQIARKAVKTKKANPSGQIKKERLTKKAKAKRKTMYGLKP